ncbi:MAG: STAS domain-containing protein [Paracoccus sp. (in: a-proteobacteria)]|nr:STAS domain-containing protein [Paracoccus sp. (in: a-proteobacteria)]
MTALTLASRLDLTAAGPLARDIAAADSLELDAGGVEFLGGLCLQILLAAAQDRRRRGLGLTLIGRSDGFDTALAQFGVDPLLLEVAG